MPHVLVGKNKGLKIKSKLLSKLLRIYPYFRLMASWAPPPMPCCHLVQGNYTRLFDLVCLAYYFSGEPQCISICVLSWKTRNKLQLLFVQQSRENKKPFFVLKSFSNNNGTKQFSGLTVSLSLFQTFFSGQQNKTRYIKVHFSEIICLNAP